MSKPLVALLPMKANSSRVPGKNFKNFAGKPLFRWILDSLLDLDEVSLVVINTDARSILESHGVYETDRVLIRDRIDHLCGDDVSMNLVLADDIENVAADAYLMTHTTNPLISAGTLESAIAAYHQGVLKGFDSLFSVNRIQSRFYTEQGKPINHDPDNLIPTQNLEPWLEENSCIYMFNQESFSRTKARIGINPLPFETPKLESSDIDNKTEWLQAEIMALSRLVFESHNEYE